MIGCGLKPNTTMHAIEEHARPPYLFGAPQTYTLTDAQRRTFNKDYIPHNFKGVIQRYDRVEGLLTHGAVSTGSLGEAKTFLINGEALFEAALGRMRTDPMYFVDPEPD